MRRWARWLRMVLGTLADFAALASWYVLLLLIALALALWLAPA
jgi:hypothetical protein